MNSPAARAVFLDRDGVLNKALIRDGKPYPPGDLSELEILPGTAQALHRLKGAGYLLITVTNQPDVARGRQQMSKIEAINQVLQAALPLDEILVCYHDDAEACACRKPSPGLLLDAARRHSLDLPRSFMIGDRWRDIEAGHRARCTTILVDYAYAEGLRDTRPDHRVGSLPEAADWILKEDRRDQTP